MKNPYFYWKIIHILKNSNKLIYINERIFIIKFISSFHMKVSVFPIFPRSYRFVQNLKPFLWIHMNSTFLKTKITNLIKNKATFFF